MDKEGDHFSQPRLQAFSIKAVCPINRVKRLSGFASTGFRRPVSRLVTDMSVIMVLAPCKGSATALADQADAVAFNPIILIF
ncbi:hypothetical protein H6F75_00230 [Nodosilinea sp. FACHB-131]|uniref:hypothetical protein n=1 Tax=Cyanophyceae TaxID=3028117 RepID=UPI0016836452|nr:hypothetical protein [Nodosilinea sp. FACHB-131]MBD1871896.1 hypothetical protein [Nodosilinea sp. FACHB-131]